MSHVDLAATPALLRNDGGNHNHWLGLTLIGGGGPASSIGAKVTVTTASRVQVKINQWATSYLSYNDPRMHFGLGREDTVERLEVHWPDGEIQVVDEVSVNRYLTVTQGIQK